MTLAELARRVKSLEKTVAELKAVKSPGRRWWVDDAGRFANDPALEEIARQGKAYRDSLRPKRRTRTKAP
jgi:hypothetical protein